MLEPDVRLRLARLAFPTFDVELDEQRFTVDLLRARNWDDPLLLLGADQLVDLPTWKEPEAVLELARVAVATRPGYDRERLDAVVARLPRPERVVLFEIEPVDVSSRELRARIAAGEAVDGLVPQPVGDLIRELGLYRDGATLDADPERT